jgi:hypothetical protein
MLSESDIAIGFAESVFISICTGLIFEGELPLPAMTKSSKPAIEFPLAFVTQETGHHHEIVLRLMAPFSLTNCSMH